MVRIVFASLIATFRCVRNRVQTRHNCDEGCPGSVLPGAGGALDAVADWGMDADGNGRITYATGPGRHPTDGNMRIEVYESAHDAESKGRSLDKWFSGYE